MQCPLQANRGVVWTKSPCHGDAQELFEEQKHVPVILGGTLNVTALPGLLYQDRHGPALGKPVTLQVPFAAHNQDGYFTAAGHSYREKGEERGERKEQKEEINKYN